MEFPVLNMPECVFYEKSTYCDRGKSDLLYIWLPHNPRVPKLVILGVTKSLFLFSFYYSYSISVQVDVLR
jgi:hypothetical protein